MTNKIVMEGKLLHGNDMIPFKIVWLIKSGTYEIECELATDADSHQFRRFREALIYLVEMYGMWSA